MEEKTLEALKASIQKWELIVDNEDDDEGVKNCALCVLFHVDEDDESEENKCCAGCPVPDTYCEESPYEVWTQYQRRNARFNLPHRVFNKVSYELAIAELEFLKSLLPGGGCMTPKQKENYSRMLAALRRIGSEYQTPDQIRRNSEEEYGVGYQDALEMAYENLQSEAVNAVKGVKKL